MDHLIPSRQIDPVKSRRAVQVPAGFAFSSAFLFTSVIHKAHSSLLHQRLPFILSDHFHPPWIQPSVPLQHWFYHSDKLPLRGWSETLPWRANWGVWGTSLCKEVLCCLEGLIFLGFVFPGPTNPRRMEGMWKNKANAFRAEVNKWQKEEGRSRFLVLFFY